MSLRSLTGRNPLPSGQKSTVVNLHLCVEELVKAAKAQGLSPIVYEDGIYDRVDYAVHMTPSRPSFHVWYDAITLGGRAYSNASAAVDFNIAGPRETAFIRNTAVPIARRWGIAYNCEDMGSPNQHLHLDVGSWANDGNGWYSAAWIGRPATLTNVAGSRGFPLPAGHWYGVNDGTPFSHSGIRGGADATNVARIQAKVGTQPDRVFGPATKTKVAAWQKTHKLTPDGKVGPATWKGMAL